MTKLIWKDVLYYCESSPSGLRRLHDWRNGYENRAVREQAGSVAGSIDGEGYYIVHALGRAQRCHRLVWQIHCGDIPNGLCIDHRDGVRTNNNISNLRLVTCTDNNRNRAVSTESLSGINGVYMCTKWADGKEYTYWTATWVSDGKGFAKNYSISKYGNDTALELAIEKRQTMLCSMPHKSTYTDRHTGAEQGEL